MSNEGESNGERRRLLQDLNHYVATHGLEDGSSGLSELEYSVAQRRVSEANEYQASIHASIFKTNKMNEHEKKRQVFLESLNADTIDLQTSTDTIRYLPLKPLADACDTIYILASSRNVFRGGFKDENKLRHLHFSLESFQCQAVKEFLSLVFKKKELDSVSCDFVVDCCEIAHYVQCSLVLNGMVDIMVRSIDSENCLSLCQLADRLNLPLLFEKSLSHVMQSLGSLEDNEDLSNELKARIATIKTAVQSSVHLQKSQLYFGSLNEYLAIFAENVQYHQERLQDAKNGLKNAGSVQAHIYISEKIEKQQERVNTLEAVLREQKKIFTHSDDGERSKIRIGKVSDATQRKRQKQDH